MAAGRASFPLFPTLVWKDGERSLCEPIACDEDDAKVTRACVCLAREKNLGDADGGGAGDDSGRADRSPYPFFLASSSFSSSAVATFSFVKTPLGLTRAR